MKELKKKFQVKGRGWIISRIVITICWSRTGTVGLSEESLEDGNRVARIMIAGPSSVRASLSW
jgi:hypothetical protein